MSTPIVDIVTSNGLFSRSNPGQSNGHVNRYKIIVILSNGGSKADNYHFFGPHSQVAIMVAPPRWLATVTALLPLLSFANAKLSQELRDWKLPDCGVDTQYSQVPDMGKFW